MRFPAWLSALIILVCCVAGGAEAREKPIPKTPEKFTDYMAERFAEAVPSAKVTVKTPLQLEVVVSNGPHTVMLARVWDFCERERRNCRKEIDDFLSNMPAAMVENADSAKPSDIRVVVRTVGYAEQLRLIAKDHPGHEGIVRPFAGDLWMICVIDMPHGISQLTRDQMTKFHLSEDEAFALGLKNVAAALPPLAEHGHSSKDGKRNYAAGDFYDSSRLLLHESWAEMSKAMSGHLIVAVPSNDFILYGEGGSKAQLTGFADFAHEILSKAPKPLSDEVFHWTPTGWEMVKP
jgi:uncharacterized protein YtpQ (UPF0354 family)